MSVLRLAMVTPRYWPLVGETERFVSNLVHELRPKVAEMTVVTADWSGEWPHEVIHREVPAIRVPSAPRGGWKTFRYMRSVARWLRDHCQQLDLVYVMNLRRDACAALGVLRNKPVGVVVRPQAGDCRWLETAKLGWRTRRRVFDADAVVAATRSLEAELLGVGYARHQVRQISNGAEAAQPRSAAARFQARDALAEANHDLASAEYAPVAVTIGRLLQDGWLFQLVDAWRPVAARWPSARLWILGDGPLRDALHERIVNAELHHQVFLPGTFDELRDVFEAADVFIATAPTSDGEQYLLEALAMGTPVVAADTPDHRDMIEHAVHGLLVPPGNTAALAEAVGTLFDAPHLISQYGESAQRHVAYHFPQSRMVEEHLELFEQVLTRKRRGKG